MISKDTKAILLRAFSIGTLVFLAAGHLLAQDWVRTGTNLGVQRIRIAAADFKSISADPQTPQLKTVFDSTLYTDLQNAGIFDVVSKSMIPTVNPGSPQELNAGQWTAAPSNADMVAFGGLGVNGGKLVVNGWLHDVKNTQSPEVLSRQYTDNSSQDGARTVAHKFANEIILRLGGLAGITESHIFFVSARSGTKEIWAMDYDGQNQHPVTHLGGISISPRVSPDSSRVAFASMNPRVGWAIRMYSLDLGRVVAFPAGTSGGTNLSPAWSGDGSRIAFSSSRSGDPEIWVADANGGKATRITAFNGPDVSPVWNPRTNSQIAWVSGRTGLPQIYVMAADGTNVQRMTDGGYATSPSWSPNGQFLAFAWNRKYGPGAPGGQDIYVMDIASRRWVQLTHESGRNDFPSWSPDGRHIVFQKESGGGSQIWSMLADGTEQHALTKSGKDSMPNWSWK